MFTAHADQNWEREQQAYTPPRLEKPQNGKRNNRLKSNRRE